MSTAKSKKEEKKGGSKGAVRYSASYWADERVPNLTELLRPHGIDADAFAAWLAPELGRYRGYEEVRSTLEVAPADQAAVLRKLRASLQSLAPLLRYGAIPPITSANLHTEGFVRGHDVRALCERLATDAHLLDILAGITLKKVEATPGRAGRKPKTGRNALLASIVARLQEQVKTTELARELAEQILVLSGVSVPEDGRSLRRAEGRGRKLPKSSG